MAKHAGFILCLVVCALGGGPGRARADTPSAGWLFNRVRIGTPPFITPS